MTLKSVVVLLVVWSLGGTTLPRQAPVDWKALTGRMETAVLEDDLRGLRGVRAELLRMVSSRSAPERLPLVHYAVAYAGWRLATNPSISKSERDDLLDEAESHLKRALVLEDSFAEAHALLSSVYGLKVANSPMKGFLLGSRAGSALDKAVALAPGNPRVLVSQGVSKFKTPRMFGGNPKEAETLLRRAVEHASKQPADAPFPAWGRFDAHVWLGQVLAQRGDTAGARAEYGKALDVAPRSGWVRYVLLPALDKKK